MSLYCQGLINFFEKSVNFINIVQLHEKQNL